jgi:hypothetical protein
MLKKLVVVAAAAAAVSVPLAGVAWSDPSQDNPGVPGNLLGASPGSRVSPLARWPGESIPDAVRDATDDAFSNPGQAVKYVNPGANK